MIGVDIVDNTIDMFWMDTSEICLMRVPVHRRLLLITIGASIDDDESSRCLLMAASKAEDGGDRGPLICKMVVQDAAERREVVMESPEALHRGVLVVCLRYCIK